MNKTIIEVAQETTFFDSGSVLRESLYFYEKEVAIKYIERLTTSHKLQLQRESHESRNFEIYFASSEVMKMRFFIDYDGINIIETPDDFPKKQKVWFTANPKWLEEQDKVPD